MFRIVRAEKLAERIFLTEVEAPRVAHSCEPGEFVIVRLGEDGERIPFTICDFDRDDGDDYRWLNNMKDPQALDAMKYKGDIS